MTIDTFTVIHASTAAVQPCPNSSSGSFATEPVADLVPAEANWENEGGLFSGGRTNHLATLCPPADLELERQAERVLVMTRALSSDCANGRVGLHHNTFEHRSRVLRQEVAKLNEMRQRQPLF